MRPVHLLFFALFTLLLTDAALFFHSRIARQVFSESSPVLNITTAALGLTDLCIATEARYTRHPAVSDGIVPFMDHPGAIEHFPTGSFWAPPSHILMNDRMKAGNDTGDDHSS